MQEGWATTGRHRTRRSWVRGVLAAVLLVVAAAPAAAQTGTIAGTITNAQTREPVPNAQVTVVGTQRVAATDERGNFLLLNIPAGAQQVRVNVIGFRSTTQSVTVEAGGTARVQMELPIAAVALDEVIVTGQAAGTARREIGTSISSISAAQLETAPITNVTQMIQSRVPGLTIMPSGGNVGQGSRIVLRGPGSLSQSVEPIIYVDGVRIDNSKTRAEWHEVGSGLGSGGASSTGLDDLNPDDIDRIEVVMGAAAATIYGTEASAGVIQIFTKQGRGSPVRWTSRTEYGITRTPRSWWDVSVFSDWFYDTLVRTGQQMSQNLGVRGSVDALSYNVSGTLFRNEGVLPGSWENRGSFRANMQITPMDRFSVQVNTGYTYRDMQIPEEGNNSRNLAMTALRGGPLGTGRSPLELLDRRIGRTSGRFTGGVTLAFTPHGDFTHRLTLGADVTNWDNVTLTPYDEEIGTSGSVYNYRRQVTTLNLDYTATYQRQLTGAVRSNTSMGFQGYDRQNNRSSVRGFTFPAPGLSTVNATGRSEGWEDRDAARSAGYFMEQQLGFNELFFVTGGARFDAHSAFGEAAGFAFYPKVDASYVVSSHDFFPQHLGTLRLRGAFGTAGQQPGVFDSEMTWEPVTALEAEPALTTGKLGDPNLTAEVSRELELGFDLGLFNERVSVGFTRYQQRTHNALFGARSPASEGFITPQLRNVGLVANDGNELAVTATVLDGRNLSWSLRGAFSTNRNEVRSLGGEAPLSVAWSQWIREGYPVGGFFEDRFILVDGEAVLASEHYQLRDADGSPLFDQDGLPLYQDGWDYIGPAFPTRTLAFSTELSVRRNLSFSVLLDHKGGHWISSSTSRWLNYDAGRVTEGHPLYDANDPSAARFAPGSPTGNRCQDPTDPIDVATCSTDWSIGRGNHIYRADNWRLREVSAAYRLPTSVAQRFGLASARLTLAGRNLWRHQPYYVGTEAEANYFTQGRLHNQSYFDTPLPQQIIGGLNVTF